MNEPMDVSATVGSKGLLNDGYRHILVVEAQLAQTIFSLSTSLALLKWITAGAVAEYKIPVYSIVGPSNLIRKQRVASLV